MRRFLPLGLGLLAATACAAPAPFDLHYVVSRDGKAIGTSQVRLAPAPGGDWSLVTETRGTNGMARLLGLEVREQSRLRWREGRPEGLSYDYRQDAAIKHKQRHAEFDWGAGEVQVSEGSREYRYAVDAGTVDRHAVALALGEALAAGRREAQLAVAVKDHVEQQQYRVAGEEELRLPAGNYRTLKVERTDAPGKIVSWYAPQVAPMPVRLEQTQGDGSVIVMELQRVGGG
ncbi:MAG TPA: DUF3108 domain-containing protein [Rhodanobacteraceae bacterium]|nr:DUF3108 domain-containing protein [Rhodanobacteraceae bacterium]